MKFICFLLSLAISLSTAPQNWCFKSAGDGTQPQILGGSGLPAEYGAVYLGDPAEKTVYLTFDAGYSNENVVSILDTLKAHDAHATFFILPGIIKYSPEVVERMASDGHSLGNHSYSHGNMANCKDTESLRKELVAMEDYYREHTGRELSKLFRPPEGAFSEQLLASCRELGYACVFWSYAYADWDNGAQPDADATLQKLLSHTHNGMVLLLHPTSATNAAILDRYLTELENQGFSFGKIEDLVS